MTTRNSATSIGTPGLGRRTLLCLTLASGLLAGCSTTPPVAQGMGSNPDGTVTTFHRKSAGSLGVFDGPVVLGGGVIERGDDPPPGSGAPARRSQRRARGRSPSWQA